jgi:hypothetical protein
MPKADTGECVVLVAIDVYSKYIWAWPYDHPGSAETTITALEDLRHRYTLPRSIYVDNGSHFVNQAVKDYLERHNVHMEVASPYSSVGVVESANHLVLDRLRHLAADKEKDPSLTTGPKTWPTKLQDAVAYLNDRVVQSLANYKTREIMFGLPPANTPRPDEAPIDITDNRTERQLRSLEVAQNAKHHPDGMDERFAINDLVLRYDGTLDRTSSTDRKLKVKWQGPFIITDLFRGSAKLALPDGMPIRGKCSQKRLKHYYGWST